MTRWFPITRRVLAGLVAGVLGVTVLTGAGAAGAAGESPERSRMVSGWFGYWTSPDDMISIARSSKGVLGEVNIFWWHYAGSDTPVCTTVDAGGCQGPSDTPWTNSRFQRAVAGLHDEGVLVFATHTDLSYTWRRSLSSYLSTEKNRRAMARKLTMWVVKSGVDGVDLDWENFAFNDGSDTWGATKPRFVDTVQRLGKRLHKRGKLLSVTVPGGYQPFTSSGEPNPGGGYSVYAWSEIADHVDRLRLMTYDYSWNRPGPIGPHEWAREAVRSAVAQVGADNREKVYVGLHQYGKAWFERDSNDDVVVVGKCRDDWAPDSGDNIALTPEEAIDLADSYDVQPRFDSESREWTFSYEKVESGHFYGRGGRRRSADCTVRKQVWFGGTETAEARAEIVADLGIGGIATWQLATLDDGYFAALAPYVTKAGPAARLRAKASDTSPEPGAGIVLKGRLKPKLEGVRIRRQLLIDGKWRTRASKVTSVTGRVRFPVRVPESAAVLTLRLKSAPVSGHGRLSSKAITVRPAR